MTLTIKRLFTRPHTLPLKSPLKWGAGHQLKTAQHVYVYAELSDGAVGVAEATPRLTIYGETPESVAVIVERELSDLLVGQSAASVDDLRAASDRVSIVKNNNTAKGAVDMALHAALAQSQGVPLRDLLGVTQKRVRASYILGTGEPEKVMEEVHEVYAAGVRCLKVKVGTNLMREIDLLRRIGEAYTDLDCYVDANECYSYKPALDILPGFVGFGALYCEEPLPVRDLTARRDLRAAQLLPLIADDSAFTLPDLRREIVFDTFDILNIKTARTGFSQSRAMLDAATASGKSVMIGSQASSALGCCTAALFAGMDGVDTPSEVTFFLKVDGEDPPFALRDGYVEMDEVQAGFDALQAQAIAAL